MATKTEDELELIEEREEDSEDTPLEYDIAVFPADFTLEVLNQKWKSKEIFVPEFQRAYVWTNVQASKLLDSFLMGLPIPPVFLYVDPDNRYRIIDGRQRLETCFFFFDGYFGEPDSAGRRKVFKLEGINKKSRWFEKTFDDLDDTDKRKLKNSVLRAIIIKQLTPKKDDTSAYHIFERLNTGGTPLLDQEVRNCVFYGQFNKLLQELNRDPNWRHVLGKPKVDPRQRDVQLILRYIALLHEGQNYQKPMKEFLSSFMNRYRNPGEQFLATEKARFQAVCELVIEKLGDRPFNPKGALNSSVFDGIFVAFAKSEGRCPADIKERYERYKKSDEFASLTSYATTDTDTVRKRLAAAEKVLLS